ncbi:hypothetical protein DPMN_099481 [Dreissena polymorpha]|uniref:Uncharacterized protein n=1 Tax=Dreissena polymorpha TaxID=45954 RepID=A0A9D4LHC3_DREPO|nr:hypothetical protein DPMN_099481 [Dreissena polymorpha]
MARQRPTRLVMGPCKAEIDRIVIREVHHQLPYILGHKSTSAISRWLTFKVNFGSVFRSTYGRKFTVEVIWCRNEEVIGAPGLVIVPCIVEIDRIVIREVQYQFEVNRCLNEEIIVKGNFGRVWSM